MILPHGNDILGDAQDDLLVRLCDGEIPTAQLPAAHAAHVAQLTGAGFGYDEASQLFWDAVRVGVAVRLAAEEKT
jgi:hypothetical protein